MSIPILATKLFIPPPRTKLVLRPRLIESLNEGLGGKLTLIAAPAGFGKTTLISEWLNDCKRPVAWLSLDEGDKDSTTFLTYVIAALQTIAPTIGEGILSVLQSSQPPSIESILTSLLNEIAIMPENFILVLDDYHIVDSKEIDKAIIFLIDHLPTQIHLVITTREDPNLPLSKLRARSQLTELRASNLRFSQDEATDFFNGIMGLDLSTEAITALEERTEGWIAGLQLAALSLHGQRDISKFIQEFAGSHRYIVDYLVEEVLANQPENVRNFLLETSILNRLNGKLCDAITRQAEGRELLQMLERGNFFLIPLDDKRQWYRYHHLFADVLRLHLTSEQPQQIFILHQRASDWYEQNGWIAEAIHHALSARDFERAARLIETASPDMRRTRQETTLLGWFKALPDDVFHNRPVLNIEYVGALLSNGKPENIETRLQDTEQWLQANPNVNPSSEMVVFNEQEYRSLPGWIVIYRAGLALAQGNISDAVMYAQEVQGIVAQDDHNLRGAATAIIGLASWTSGNLKDAFQSYADGMAHLRMAGNISDVVGGSLGLADIRITQGRLRDAIRIYEQALDLASQHDEPQMRGTADMYVGLSEINRQYNKLHIAEQYLLRAKEQGEHTGFPQNPYRWRVAMAQWHQANNDLDGALDFLHEAERVYVSDFYPNVRPVAAMKTRVVIAQGKLDEALVWVREQRLSVQDELSYLREFEHITLARVLLAQAQRKPDTATLTETMILLERLLKTAEDGERTGSMIEILILQALAYQMQGNIASALSALEHALKLAEPESYVRVFIDEGYPMMTLLEKVAKHDFSPSYVRQLLRAFDKPESKPLVDQNLIDPLSERELEVLRLLATDLDGPEIARELIVSLNTIRSHTKNIYTKLGVNNRRTAIRRAEELNLL